MPLTGSVQPLAGCLVLDFSQYVSGPTVTRLMAEMGAEVIKVELSPIGDPSRLMPILKQGRSAYFVQQNQGKQSVCVDWSKPEGVNTIRKMVAKADVVVENFAPGVMAKRGLDYDGLRVQKPDLIMASISGFGQISPLSHKPCVDGIAQAFSAMMHMTGSPDGAPMPVGMSIADGASGVMAFAAIGYALLHREKTGQGQHIDIAMVNSIYHLHDFSIAAHTVTDGKYLPERTGERHPLISPCGLYSAPENWIYLVATQQQWPRLSRMIGGGLEDDERFATTEARLRNRRELDVIIEQWLQSFPDNATLESVLEKNRILCSFTLSIADTLAHPYFEARGLLRHISDPALGKFTVPGFPFKSTAFDPQLPHGAPNLGEHNRVALERLGFSPSEVSGLEKSAVLKSAST